MPRHHFVPQFLLSGWASSGQLKAYRWIEAAGKVVMDFASVAEACQVADLHSFFGLARGEREAPERQFFTPEIDTPAADVHAVLLEEGVRGLTPAQRTAWARFLIAFGCRTPEALRKLGPEQYRLAMTQNQENPAGSPEEEAKVNSWIAQNIRALERNVVLGIAMEFADDPTKFMRVAEMHWWLRRFKGRSILLGDRPLLSQPTANWPCGVAIEDVNCLIALPIAPDVVFFASANRRLQGVMRTEAPSKLVHNINQRTIESIVEYVFAADISTDAFVRERLHGRPGSVWPRSTSTAHLGRGDED